MIIVIERLGGINQVASIFFFKIEVFIYSDIEKNRPLSLYNSQLDPIIILLGIMQKELSDFLCSGQKQNCSGANNYYYLNVIS
jgi:hypothetical protein